MPPQTYFWPSLGSCWVLRPPGLSQALLVPGSQKVSKTSCFSQFLRPTDPKGHPRAHRGPPWDPRGLPESSEALRRNGSQKLSSAYEGSYTASYLQIPAGPEGSRRVPRGKRIPEGTPGLASWVRGPRGPQEAPRTCQPARPPAGWETSEPTSQPTRQPGV